jgi:3-hydroxyisobutyrate dehydrogenase-like beta-hydroxyacid dehydrogenase
MGGPTAANLVRAGRAEAIYAALERASEGNADFSAVIRAIRDQTS